MNVLIVGLGSIARKHIAALRSLEPEVQIYALRSTRFSNSVDGVTDLFSMKEVEEYSFDFAIISNPTSEHQKTIQQMGVLNIPLFIEKPLSHQLDVKETVVEIERKNVLTYVACNLRFWMLFFLLSNILPDPAYESMRSMFIVALICLPGGGKGLIIQ